MFPGHVQWTRSTSTNSSGDCAPRALNKAQGEDPLAELSRLVEFSHMGIANGETPARRAAEPAVARAAPVTSIETGTLRPTLDDEVEELAPGASEADRAARRDYEFDGRHSDGASAADAGEERRPMRWKIAVSALALAGVAMIGGVFALRHGGPGFSKGRPVHRGGAGTDEGCAAQRADGHDVQRRLAPLCCMTTASRPRSKSSIPRSSRSI